MIPKKIHYCWFGGNPLPELAVKCISGWKKFCPDYEIIEWNETNYDVTKNEYMRQAYENKKWGFVPDYARLDIIYNNGGIYLDTDVELVKPLDPLLELDAFAGVEQNSEYVALGLGFGAKPNHPAIKALRDYYNEISFAENGALNLTPAPQVNYKVFCDMGYEFLPEIHECGGITVFPAEYFCPIDYDTGKLCLTENAFSIHHYTATWYDEAQKYALKLKRKFVRFLPHKVAAILATTIAKARCEGIGACIKWIFKKRR